MVSLFSLTACNSGNVIKSNNDTAVNQVQVKQHINISSTIHNLDNESSDKLSSFGLKPVEVTNATAHEISALEFPHNLPSDITYDLGRTTCSLKGKQKLAVKQSCLLVFRYAPKIDGVMANVVITISGLSNVNGVAERVTSSPMDIEFTSIRTKRHFYEIKKTNVALTDLLVENHSDMTYGSDSITDIPVGSFGLKTLVVTNSTTFNIYSVTFPLLPAEFSYDQSTTCKTSVGNKSILLPGEECILVLRYSPTKRSQHGTLPIATIGTNDYYDVIANKVLYLAYSSQK